MRYSTTSILFCLGLAACQRQLPPALATEPPTYTSHEECKFVVGGVTGAFCQIPFVALLSDPRRFDGKRIFTYAYIWRAPAPDEGFSITLEPRLRRSADAASCALVINQVKGDDIDLKTMERVAPYSVALGGTFRRIIGQAPCIGALENVDVQYLNKEP